MNLILAIFVEAVWRDYCATYEIDPLSRDLHPGAARAFWLTVAVAAATVNAGP